MIRRLLFAALPFAVIVAIFAVALRHHLGEPERAVRTFESRLSARLAAASADADDGVAPTDFISVSHAPCAKGCVAHDVRVDAGGRMVFAHHVPVCPDSAESLIVVSRFAHGLIGAAGDSGVLTMPEPARRVAANGASTTLVVRHGTVGRRLVYGDALDAPLPAAIAQAVDRLGEMSSPTAAGVPCPQAGRRTGAVDF